jgi:hypothetical protein
VDYPENAPFRERHQAAFDHCLPGSLYRQDDVPVAISAPTLWQFTNLPGMGTAEMSHTGILNARESAAARRNSIDQVVTAIAGSTDNAKTGYPNATFHWTGPGRTMDAKL